MVALFRTFFALATLATAATAASVASRSSKLTFTVYNKCQKDFAPIFLPALPGKTEWPVIKVGSSQSYSFYSDTYRGKVFAPLLQANSTTGQGATQGEFDLATGDYDISVADGYNVGMYMQLMGREFEGYCQAAYCNSNDCPDAYKVNSGLLSASRIGDPTAIPNHNCPPTFTTWLVQFC